METLHKQEIERALKLEREQAATQAVLEQMRDAPNTHLHNLAQEVALLQSKINPILSRVEDAQQRISQSRGGSSSQKKLGD